MMLFKLLSAMDRRRFSNVVVSMTSIGEVGARIQTLGIEVRSLGMKHTLPTTFTPAWRFFRILREQNPHILQTWLYHSDFFGLCTAPLARVPALVWTIRCSDMDWSYYSSLSRFEIKILARFSKIPKTIIVNSQAGRKVHEALRYRPRSWTVIPNGFDVERFRPDQESRTRLRASLGVAAETPLIGMVARFDPMKDHATFLKAAADLLRTDAGSHFVLVGHEVVQSNRDLAAMVRDLGLGSRVHLLGPRPDVAAIMPGFDIASLSSISEGFPNVIGEAMACGVPCVATDVGDVAEIVQDTGRIVPPRNPHALADAWRSLLAMNSDSRRALGMAARRRIQVHYSLAAVAARFEHVYREVARVAP